MELPLFKALLGSVKIILSDDESLSLRVLSILPGNDSVNPGAVRRGDGRQFRSFLFGKICCRVGTILGTGRETGEKLPNSIYQTKRFIRAKERIYRLTFVKFGSA
jgi:hypothetical protein